MSMKVLYGKRIVATYRGDTLQRIAARELGDPERWYELAEINGLRPPYLTDDESQVSATVLPTGSSLFVPAFSPRVAVDDAPDDVLGRDVRLGNGDIQIVNGDFAVAAELDNYAQAIRHLIDTDPADILFHPYYGAGVRLFLGSTNSRAKAVLLRELVKRAIEHDDRTQEVRSAVATVTGDVIRIEAVAVAVNGKTVQASKEF